MAKWQVRAEGGGQQEKLAVWCPPLNAGVYLCRWVCLDELLINSYAQKITIYAVLECLLL